MFAAGTNWVTLTVELLPHWIQGLMYLKTVHVFTLQFVLFFLIYAFYIRYCEKSLFPALTFELKFDFCSRCTLWAHGKWKEFAKWVFPFPLLWKEREKAVVLRYQPLYKLPACLLFQWSTPWLFLSDPLHTFQQQQQKIALITTLLDVL